MSTEYTVQQGDCIDSIAFSRGFFPDTLWNHPENSELKNLRKDPNILQPGDVVIIPELTLGDESRATDKKHRFRRKGVPAKLSLVFYKSKPDKEKKESAGGAAAGSGGSTSGSPLPGLLGRPAKGDDESVFEDSAKEPAEPEVEPIINAPYLLDIDGTVTDGESDGDGKVEVPIMPNARRATIKFHAGTENEISFPLSLGEMDSIETVIGVRKRLYNMAYRCAPEGDGLDPDLKDAVMRFQKENKLKPTGKIDQATKDKLVQVHGS